MATRCYGCTSTVGLQALIVPVLEPITERSLSDIAAAKGVITRRPVPRKRRIRGLSDAAGSETTAPVAVARATLTCDTPFLRRGCHRGSGGTSRSSRCGRWRGGHARGGRVDGAPVKFGGGVDSVVYGAGELPVRGPPRCDVIDGFRHGWRGWVGRFGSLRGRSRGGRPGHDPGETLRNTRRRSGWRRRKCHVHERRSGGPSVRGSGRQRYERGRSRRWWGLWLDRPIAGVGTIDRRWGRGRRRPGLVGQGDGRRRRLR